jgi:hypothetical protein
MGAVQEQRREAFRLRSSLVLRACGRGVSTFAAVWPSSAGPVGSEAMASDRCMGPLTVVIDGSQNAAHPAPQRGSEALQTFGTTI